MASTTTSSLSATTGVPIAAHAAAGVQRLQEMIYSTTIELSKFELARALGEYSDDFEKVVYYCVNNWWEESKFRQIFNGDSRGYSRVDGQVGNSPPNPVVVANSRILVYKSYWNITDIVTKRSILGDSDPGLIDGLYPHGVSQTLGCYFIRAGGINSAFATLTGLPRYSSLMRDLIIDPGARVIDLFPDTPEGRQLSIRAGLMVLDYWYRYASNLKGSSIVSGNNIPAAQFLAAIGENVQQGDMNKKITPRQAFFLAFVGYVGWVGKDVNNTSGTIRAVRVRSLNTRLLTGSFSNNEIYTAPPLSTCP